VPVVNDCGNASGDVRFGYASGDRGSIRDALRARGQESMTAVFGGGVDRSSRLDLQARGDVVLASVCGKPGAGPREVVPGILTVATILPGPRDALQIGVGGWNEAVPQVWQRSPLQFSPQGMWWHGYADATSACNVHRSSQKGAVNQDNIGGYSCWDELPLKIDLDSLASAGLTVSPPPGV